MVSMVSKWVSLRRKVYLCSFLLFVDALVFGMRWGGCSVVKERIGILVLNLRGRGMELRVMKRLRRQGDFVGTMRWRSCRDLGEICIDLSLGLGIVEIGV